MEKSADYLKVIDVYADEVISFFLQPDSDAVQNFFAEAGAAFGVDPLAVYEDLADAVIRKLDDPTVITVPVSFV